MMKKQHQNNNDDNINMIIHNRNNTDNDESRLSTSSRASSSSDYEKTSSMGGGSSTYTGSQRTKVSQEEQEQLAAKESKAIFRSKFLFVFILLSVGAAAGVLTYYFLNEEEHKEFEAEFTTLAREIDDVSNHKAKTLTGIVQGFANGVTSVGAFANIEWPYLTLPHFHIRASELLLNADTSFIAVSPIVKSTNLQSWENYTYYNHDWLLEEPPCTLISMEDQEDEDHHDSHDDEEDNDDHHDSHDEEEEDQSETEDSHDDHDHRKMKKQHTANNRMMMLKRRLASTSSMGSCGVSTSNHDSHDDAGNGGSNSGTTTTEADDDSHDDGHNHRVRHDRHLRNRNNRNLNGTQEGADGEEDHDHDDDLHQDGEVDGEEDGEHHDGEEEEDGDHHHDEEEEEEDGDDEDHDHDEEDGEEEHHDGEEEDGDHHHDEEEEDGDDDHGDDHGHGDDASGDDHDDKQRDILPPGKVYPMAEHDNDLHDRPYVPVWQTSPTQDRDVVNFDLLSNPIFHRIFDHVIATNEPVLSEVIDVPSLFGPNAPNYNDGSPQSILIEPIFDEFEDHAGHGGDHDDHVVGVLIAILPWGQFFSDFIHEDGIGVMIVLANTCGGLFTYEIQGHEAIYLGPGDLHDPKYSYLEIITDFKPFLSSSDDGHDEHNHRFLAEDDHDDHDHDEEDKGYSADCRYSFHIYPTQQLEESYKSNNPTYIAFIVVVVFLFVIGAFLVYDYVVRKRHDIVMDSAMKSKAIVSSLFPKEFHDRLFKGGKGSKKKNSSSNNSSSGYFPDAQKHRMRNFLESGEDPQSKHKSSSNNELAATAGDLLISGTKPIADLFPEATVLFADIAGFTAWSSVRDPSQVFTLLESIYNAFDNIAKRRRVFKVETIGDSYVAVTGLPEPQDNHAIIMVKFARECLTKLVQITQVLEVTLGPGTGDLSMRFGMHSGPVTAGVLRGERARFQLFGDTVNTASRMESSGMRGRIQVSQSTADCLVVAGKGGWLSPREDTVIAKGLGAMSTYWVDPERKRNSDSSQAGDSNTEAVPRPKELSNNAMMIRHERLKGWMVELLSGYLKKILRKRAATGTLTRPGENNGAAMKYDSPHGRICLDEVVESLPIPEFDGTMFCSEAINLDPQVVAELKEYVHSIADFYRDNPFHNMDHACHVTMSCHKLLQRIVSPDMTEEDYAQGMADESHLASRLYDYTHGINSDPLIMTAIVFSALIHDVDHRGVSNIQLGKEEPAMAEYYKQKSIAEQNSLDVSWDLLMSSRFDNLRGCMFSSKEDLMRFRQTIVNIVLATDIFDKELNDLRKLRWSKAFADKETSIDNNLRATIVMEHIIQASDVSHTMQHWHVYIKWNNRLFREMSTAFKEGRMGADPASFWYEGELKFFDNYIIPLAKKLKECQVFGVSSDEYLNYALSNRAEWEMKGKSVIENMISEIDTVKPDSFSKRSCRSTSKDPKCKSSVDLWVTDEASC